MTQHHDIRALVREAALAHGIDPTIFDRQIRQESGYQAHVVSKAGARGIAQFMPATAAAMGVNPDSIRSSLDGAARLDAANLRKYGNWRDALAAYNGGPGAVGHLPAETRNYIAVILGGHNASATGGERAGAPSHGATAPTAPHFVDPETHTDTTSAIIAALTDHHHGGSLLQRLQANIGSGQFTTQTPGHWAAGQAGAPASSTRDYGLTKTKGGVTTFDGKKVAAWIKPVLAYARQHGWTGNVQSGVRSLAEQTRIYNSGVRPAAKPGTSNHEMTAFPGGAVDVSNAAQLAAIIKVSPYAGKLVWAGAKDPVHFSHPHNGSY